MDINKLPPGVRSALRERGVKDAVVAIMTPREVFEEYCNWNGIINWSDTLWDTMQALVQAQPAPASWPAGEPFPLTHSPGKLAEIQGFTPQPGDVNVQFESPRCMGVTKPLEGDAGAVMQKADGELRKVVVVLEGGIVNQVLVGEEGVSVAVIDYDDDGNLNDLIMIPQADGMNQYAIASIREPEVNPARVDELYAAVEEARPADDDDESQRARP